MSDDAYIWTLIRCWYCGNVGSDDQPLVEDRYVSTRARHYPGTDDEPLPCPPPPDGFAACVRCHNARRVEFLAHADFRPCNPADGGIKVPIDGVDTWIKWVPQMLDDYLEDEDGNALHVCLYGGCTSAPKDKPRDESGEDDDQAHDADTRLTLLPTDGDGMGVQDAMAAWGTGERKTRDYLAAYVKEGRARVGTVPTKAGGMARRVYWRVDE